MHAQPPPAAQEDPPLEWTVQLPNLGSNRTVDVSEGFYAPLTASIVYVFRHAVLHLDLRPRLHRNNCLPARWLAALSPSVMARLPVDLADVVDEFIATFPSTPFLLLHLRCTDAQPQPVR